MIINNFNKILLLIYRNGEIKTLLADLLGQEAIRTQGLRAAETARLFKASLGAMRQELAGVDEEVLRIANERGRLQGAEDRVARRLSERQAAQATLEVARQQQAQLLAEQDQSRSTEARRSQLQAIASLPCALVFYEAPHRIEETLADRVAELDSRRQVTLARELTKRFETIVTLPLADAPAWLAAGLSNEIIWICSQFADGITTAIGIGGDAYPGTDYVSYLEMFENDPQTKAVVIVGEMGGDLEERAAQWYGAKKRRVKLIAVVSGFCQESLPKGMKFGHAGAKEGMKGEGSARSKPDALKKAGALVPATFGALGPAIKDTYEELLKSGQVKAPVEPLSLPKLPKTVEEAMKADEVMVAPLIRTTISDDRADETCYDGYPASELINKGYEIPHVIGLLWDKRLISKQEAEIIKRIMMLSADHGPCVSGAYATILAGLMTLILTALMGAQPRRWLLAYLCVFITGLPTVWYHGFGETFIPGFFDIAATQYPRSMPAED